MATPYSKSNVRYENAQAAHEDFFLKAAILPETLTDFTSATTFNGPSSMTLLF